MLTPRNRGYKRNILQEQDIKDNPPPFLRVHAGEKRTNTHVHTSLDYPRNNAGSQTKHTKRSYKGAAAQQQPQVQTTPCPNLFLPSPAD